MTLCSNGMERRGMDGWMEISTVVVLTVERELELKEGQLYIAYGGSVDSRPLALHSHR